ncbi:hypothetical protein [Oceanobacillus chungangensis]|uniref:Uncharacterized protein n=1 Tax=Oceanobacillus chungangensis TaxID=1229152 RepID=A0A3D8PJX3_9BACI|nr:hypothetical protein [Oceanobacillus chungangensis]RDW15972.1 hypothetical protein CWR45_15880 [Oceanobacillus chungangensis]
MSEKKQVIHVKDLVIKADNVIIENSHRRDPLFGDRRERREVEEVSEHHEYQESDKKEERNERRPFWF